MYPIHGICHGDVINHRIELSSSIAKEALLSETVKRLNFLMGQVIQMSDLANYLNRLLA